jgi:hypothetical protein
MSDTFSCQPIEKPCIFDMRYLTALGRIGDSAPISRANATTTERPRPCKSSLSTKPPRGRASSAAALSACFLRAKGLRLSLSRKGGEVFLKATSRRGFCRAGGLRRAKRPRHKKARRSGRAFQFIPKL